MTRLLDLISHLITSRPIVTLIVLLAVTVFLGAGFTRMAPQADNTAFLPEGSRVHGASSKIDQLFGGTKDVVTATLLFRGDALTPEGLAQIDGALDGIASDPRISPLFDHADPIVAPTLLVAAALGIDDFGMLTQAEIDQIGQQLPLNRFVGVDTDGSAVAIASVRLTTDIDGDGEIEDDAEAVVSAESAIREIIGASQGPLEGSSLSPAILSEETQGATGSDMLVLMGVALGVIALLLLLFTRSIFDLILSLLGLVLTIVWVIGAQGWLGPNGLGLMGPPNPLTTMVPIMLIGLVVDYAISDGGSVSREAS